jgi:hypothetical protein
MRAGRHASSTGSVLDPRLSYDTMVSTHELLATSLDETHLSLQVLQRAPCASQAVGNGEHLGLVDQRKSPGSPPRRLLRV